MNNSMPTPSKYEATVVISTINRQDDLRRALFSTVAQTGLVEIIVTYGGSTDGTVEMVKGEFPTVRIFR